MPMDVEWAHTQDGELKLLQARPITTLYPLDEAMLTPPGERRRLYYDYNIASEATTTAPFTHMDLMAYSQFIGLYMGNPNLVLPEDPNMPIFNGATRQYMNFSHVLKFMGASWFADSARTLDPYLAALFESDDCSRSKYRTAKLPPEVGCCSACAILWQAPLCSTYRMKRRCGCDSECRIALRAMITPGKRMMSTRASGPVFCAANVHLSAAARGLSKNCTQGDCVQAGCTRGAVHIGLYTAGLCTGGLSTGGGFWPWCVYVRIYLLGVTLALSTMFSHPQPLFKMFDTENRPDAVENQTESSQSGSCTCTLMCRGTTFRRVWQGGLSSFLLRTAVKDRPLVPRRGLGLGLGLGVTLTLPLNPVCRARACVHKGRTLGLRQHSPPPKPPTTGRTKPQPSPPRPRQPPFSASCHERTVPVGPLCTHATRP